MKKIILYAALIISVSAFSTDIKVTLEKPQIIIRMGDVSQKAQYGPEGVVFIPHKGYRLVEKPTQKAREWFNKYTSPISLIVTITNISNKELKLFQEWNSWGYYNLKLIFRDEFHEYWVTKKEGEWYRNFPQITILKPKESFSIPVALSPAIWNGIKKVKEKSKRIITIRALYEQYPSRTIIKCNDVWKGSVSSKYYFASKLLPNLYLKKLLSRKDKGENLKKKHKSSPVESVKKD